MSLKIIEKDNVSHLTYEEHTANSLAKYATSYLLSPRNTYFIPWNSRSNGITELLYFDISGFIDLDTYLNKATYADVLELINIISKAVESADNSVLLKDNLILEKEFIFLRKSKKIDLTLPYLPLKRANQSESDLSNSYQKLISYLVGKLEGKDKFKKGKDLHQKLIAASSKGYKTVLKILIERLDVKKSQSDFQVNLKKSFSNVVNTLENMKLPTLLIILSFMALITIYIIDYFTAGINTLSLAILLGVIFVCSSSVILLLLIPKSPYRIRLEENATDLDEYSFIEVPAYADSMNLHPLKSNRTMAMELIKGSLPGKADRWLVLGSEFIIGNSNRSDLNLGLDGDEVVLRILQRAGTFFVQRVSASTDVFLMGRLLTRHDEYELSDKAMLQIDNMYFKLVIK